MIQDFSKYRENKTHTDKSFPYNTYLCSIPLDFSSVPLHWHEEVELIVIKKGQGIVCVDLETYPVSANDILIVLPGHLHSIRESAGHSMEYENIIFRRELLTTQSEDVCSEFFLPLLFNGNLTIEHYIHPGLPYYEDILAVITRMDDLSMKRPTAYQIALKSCLFQLFYLLITNQRKKAPTRSELRSQEKMKSVIRHIADHYQEPLTIEQMADLCHFSSSHFMKFFKANTGTSFIHYLNDYRIQAARHLLCSTSDSVLSIAQQCGFDNLSYFNRLFKKRYGVTPRQLR